MSLKDKVVIVTGGARGIGRAIILELAREGVKLSFNFSKSSVAAEELLQEAKALGSEILSFQVDVRDFAKVKAMVDQTIEKFGKIDGLINNAGVNRDGTF